MSLYPCPTCANVMLPGRSYTSARDPKAPGAGKVWAAYSGAAGIGFGVRTGVEGQYVTCHRCGGTGLVEERRRGAGDRRKNLDRREGEA